MKIKDYDNRLDVSVASARVSALIDQLKEIPGQDYFNMEDLEKTRERMRDDIWNYSEEVRKKAAESCIKVGKIIRLTTSDAISYTKKTYLKISEVRPEDDQVICDIIEVVKGDTVNSISYKEQEREAISEILTSVSSGIKEGPDIDEEYGNYIKSLTTIL